MHSHNNPAIGPLSQINQQPNLPRHSKTPRLHDPLYPSLARIQDPTSPPSSTPATPSSKNRSHLRSWKKRKTTSSARRARILMIAKRREKLSLFSLSPPVYTPEGGEQKRVNWRRGGWERGRANQNSINKLGRAAPRPFIRRGASAHPFASWSLLSSAPFVVVVKKDENGRRLLLVFQRFFRFPAPERLRVFLIFWESRRGGVYANFRGLLKMRREVENYTLCRRVELKNCIMVRSFRK